MRYYKLADNNRDTSLDYRELPEKYDTFEEAYDELCTKYVKQKDAGINPIKRFMIIEHSISNFEGHESEMIKPCWN